MARLERLEPLDLKAMLGFQAHLVDVVRKRFCDELWIIKN